MIDVYVIRAHAIRAVQAAVLAMVLAVVLVPVGGHTAHAAQATPDQSALAVGDADLQGLLATLEDEAARAKLAQDLRALLALRRADPTQGPAPTIASAEPTSVGLGGGESLGGQVVAALSQSARATSEQVVALAKALANLPELLGDITERAADPEARSLWADMLMILLAVLAIGTLVEMAVRRLLAAPRANLEGRATGNVAVRTAYLLARTVVDVVPVVAFAGAAYLVLFVAGGEHEARLVSVTLINAYVLGRAILVIARMILVPKALALRVVPLADETAWYLFVWCRRFTLTVLVGYFAADVGLMLGVSYAGYVAFLKFIGLLVAGMVLLFISQNRLGVAGWLHGHDDSKTIDSLRGLRTRVGDVWHILASLYVVAIYGSWLLEIEGGFAYLMTATGLTLLILVVGRMVLFALNHAIERLFAISAEGKARFPGLERRANRYLPLLRRGLMFVVYGVVALALGQSWGLDAFGWLQSEAGARGIEVIASTGTVLILAVLAWESINSAVERYLNRTDADGNPLPRSGRIRTLLPLVRNVVFVVMTVMVGLIIMSELGINIAPMLAGAGVVGLAIGFGAQTLVKDIITGAFILIEDTISVGDVVRVGGHAGVVEALTIRSLRLRDAAGMVHTLPFSSVDTITNMTKDYSYYVFNVGVAYRESVDDVMEALRQLGEEFQAEPEYSQFILEPLDIQGVDQLADSAVVIKARFKTTPVKQWFVGREFNRRIKNRFDELGIEIPYPHTTIYFGEDKEGKAPPAFVRQLADAPRKKAAKADPPKESTPQPTKVDLPSDAEIDQGDGEAM